MAHHEYKYEEGGRVELSHEELEELESWRKEQVEARNAREAERKEAATVIREQVARVSAMDPAARSDVEEWFLAVSFFIAPAEE